MRDAALYAIVFVLVRLLSALPAGAARALGRALGTFAFRVVRFRRKVVLANLRYVLGGTRTEAELFAIAADAYRQFGMTGVEIMRLCRLDLAPAGLRVEVEQLDRLRARRAANQPLIFCTPHNANFDAGAYAVVQSGLPTSVVMKRVESPRINEMVVATRERNGLRMIVSGSSTYQELVGVLRSGGWVAILPDQNARGRGIRVSFLGKPASFYKGPALLHLETGAPITVGVVVRSREDFGKLTVRMISVEPVAPTADRDADLVAVMQKVADAMAQIILPDPAQYFWFHRLWGKEIVQADGVAPAPEAALPGANPTASEIPRRSPASTGTTP